MKSFIKKYPKRIIVTALVVLLIAIVGTANNYRTYRKGVPATYSIQHIDENIVEFLNEIYGKVISTSELGYTRLCYNGKNLTTGVQSNGISEKFMEVKIDDDSYANDDTISVTIENKLFSDISFYTGKYMLQIYDGASERYYDVYGGVTAVADKGELVKLQTGETYENKIELSSLKNLSKKPITLIPGSYRLSIPVFVNNNPEFSDEEDNWFTFKFDIK